MKKNISLLLVLFNCTFIFSQEKINYKIGDTIYYKNNILSNKKGSTFYAIIKNKQQKKKSILYTMEGYRKQKDSAIFRLYSEYQTRIIEKNHYHGSFIYYHKNGKQLSKGIMISNKPVGKWTYWYDDGNIREEKNIYKNKTLSKNIKLPETVNFWDRAGNQTIIDGNGSFELKEGSITSTGNYKNGKRHGKWTCLNGDKKKYEEYYKNGKIKKGKSWDKKGNTYKYNKTFVNPKFKRGTESIKAHLLKHFTVPDYAITNNLYGKMIVGFKINKDGTLSDIKMIKSICLPCDEEAIRVIKLMKGWKPLMERGQKRKVGFTLPISYKLKQ